MDGLNYSDRLRNLRDSAVNNGLIEIGKRKISYDKGIKECVLTQYTFFSPLS